MLPDDQIVMTEKIIDTSSLQYLLKIKCGHGKSMLTWKLAEAQGVLLRIKSKELGHGQCRPIGQFLRHRTLSKEADSGGEGII